MSQAFTGFPSRCGHFGIRRLNVSFGLGPHGVIGIAAAGVPVSRSEEERPAAATEEAEPVAAGCVEAPGAASQQRSAQASSESQSPKSTGKVVGPVAATKKMR